MCKMDWQNKGIWSQIEKIKPIFVELRIKDEFSNTMKKYYQQINNATMKGAIFMAVCRGKVSEGLDFADINGRAVIITGLPFAPVFDPQIRLKKSYMQHNHTTTNDSLSGDQWYQLEAARAVNQAIGRVIRHRNDYGAILLCDCRFNRSDRKNKLPRWIQRHTRLDNSRRSFDAITASISQFFRSHQMASVGVTGNSSTVVTSITRSNDAITPAEQSVFSQDSRAFLQIVNELSDTNQPIVANHTILESPISTFARQIASLPLSSPSHKLSPLSSSNNADSMVHRVKNGVWSI